MTLFKNINVVYKNILLIALLFLCNTQLHAHPFLWKVSGEHEFYMFGTIHLPDPRVTELSEEVEQALQAATAFYAELDLSESNTMMIRQSMWLPENKTLHNFLPAKLETDIIDYLQKINPELNLEFFSKQKIWVLAITLTVLEQQLKFPGQPALDAVLFQKATSLGMKTGGLETVEDQLQVFEAMNTKQQIAFLSDTVEFMKSAKANQQDFIEQSLKAYLQGDIDQLMMHLMSYMKDDAFYEDLLDRLINQRNVKMADTMISLVSKNINQKYFFAIGAGHFWGDNGIHSILENKGYDIQVID